MIEEELKSPDDVEFISIYYWNALHTRSIIVERVLNRK